MNSNTLVSCTRANLVALAALTGLIAACSAGGTTTTGGSSGNGSSGGGTSGGPVITPAPGPSGSSDPGSPSTSSGGASAAIYCGGDGTTCACSHDSAYGDLASPCSSGTVGSPSLCCSTGGWPGSSGGCACTQVVCNQYSSDTCICGAAGTVTHAVGSCSQPEGGVCCLDTGAFGTQLCSCHTDLAECPPDEQTVSSCSVASVGCTADASKVSSCR